MESTIGARIRQLREARQLSVADFAKAAGVKPSAVYGLESGQSKPSLETVGAMRKSFPGLNTEWLQFGEGEMFGRALASVAAHSRTHGEARTAVQASEPASALTVALPTPEEYRQLQRENQELREQLARKEGALVAVEEDRTWLRKQIGGKTEASADAATDYEDEPAHMELYRNHEYDHAAELAAAYRRPAASCWMDFAS